MKNYTAKGRTLLEIQETALKQLATSD